MADITIVIPSIPPRSDYLKRAISSCLIQADPVAAIAISIDQNKEGAWTTRNRGLATVKTTWTGFLDDDDELLPYHVQFLMNKINEHDLDLAWGWFDVVGGEDPFPVHRGRQYNPLEPHIFPITYIVRTELLHAAVEESGGFLPDLENHGGWHIQDQPVVNAMMRLGARHMAFEEKTWKWHHHGDNTSGQPERW